MTKAELQAKADALKASAQRVRHRAQYGDGPAYREEMRYADDLWSQYVQAQREADACQD